MDKNHLKWSFKKLISIRLFVLLEFYISRLLSVLQLKYLDKNVYSALKKISWNTLQCPPLEICICFKDDNCHLMVRDSSLNCQG